MTQASVTTTAAQRDAVLRVPAPAARETLTVNMLPGSGVQLPFNPGEAVVSRSGNDLVFELENGGTVTIADFFVTENGGDLPTLILPQGEEVAASLAFADSGFDLATAAGPAAGSSGAGGSGEYADDAGSLISGVDGLDSLDATQWDRDTEAPEIYTGAAPGLVAETATPGPGPLPGPIVPDSPDGPGDDDSVGPGDDDTEDPGDDDTDDPGDDDTEDPGDDDTDDPGDDDGSDDPVEPKAPFDYVARGVIYPGEPAKAQDGQRENVELKVDLLSNGGKSTYPPNQAPGSVSLLFFDKDGKGIDPLLPWSYNQAKGTITFKGCPPDGVYYVLVTDSNGNKYYMQLVADSDGDFNSAAQDAATPPPNGGLSHGEWHSGKGTPLDGEHDVISSNKADAMTFASGVSGATIKTGHAQDGKWGNDTITVQGNVADSDITFGTGRDTMTVTGNVSGSSIDTGAGNDRVTIQGSVSESRINTGADNDTVTINGHVDTTSINTGAGNDTVTINGHLYSGASIDTGTGNDTVTISGHMHAGTSVTMGEGNDVLTIGGHLYGNAKIYTGDGHDQVTINGNLLNSGNTINTGDGNDQVTIKGSVAKSVITTGDGDDTVTINKFVTGSTINTGDGDDTVIINGIVTNSTISLGDDNDMLRLAGFAGGLLDGGTGEDTLVLSLDGLGGAKAFEAGGAFSGLFKEGAVKNFEEIILDMNGGAGDTRDVLDLDTLLSGLEGLRGDGPLVVHIMGGNNDKVDIGDLEASGWKCTSEGVGGSVWTNTNEDLTFIIQNNLTT